MIRYLEHSEIDRQRWDDCIFNAPNAIIYAASWYLDIVAPRHWDALMFGDYETVFPLTWNRKLGISYLYQPFFTQQLGVFGSNAALMVPDFIRAIPARFLKTEINLNTFNPVESSAGFHIQTARTHHLSLSEKYGDLLAGYSASTRRNLKKIQSRQLAIEDMISPREMVHLFRETVGRKTPEIKDRHYEMLRQLLEESGKRELLYCNGLRNEQGELTAGMAFLRYKNSIIYLLGAAQDHDRENGGMQLLMDNCIHAHANSGLLLDFEGSEIPGIARFFKSFGAHEVNYYRLRINRLPRILRLLKK